MVTQEEASSAFGGRYRLLDLVGAGSNAEVYTADDLTLRRRVAVKLLRADLLDDEGFRRRFEHEMRAVSALSFPRLLPVYDWGLDPVPYVVTEHVAGGSLADMLASGHRLSPSQALAVGLEAARALVRIHGAGSAYGGLTLSSIMFDSEARVFISDLGLASALAVVGAGAQEHVRYTPADQKADVHDLALVLNEAVTGLTSLPGEGADAALASAVLLDPLQNVLVRVATADPAERLNASGFNGELLRVAALLPRPEPLPLATAARPAAAHGDAGLPPDAAPQSGAVYEWAPTPVSARSAIPLDDTPRRRWPGVVLATVLVLGAAAAGVWAWQESRPGAASVPVLAGRDIAFAKSAAADLGWEVEEILVRQADTSPDEVVRTEPVPGESLGEGETLAVFVSLGDPLVVLDDRIWGYTVQGATVLLAEQGLVVDDETPVADEVVPPGRVVGIDVDGAVYELEVGTEVNLMVSTGPADRIVPTVPEGRALIAAVDALLVARLVPFEVTEFSVDVPVGEVIGFDPPSGEAAQADSEVVIRVSLGPDPQQQAQADGAGETDETDEAGESGG